MIERGAFRKRGGMSFSRRENSVPTLNTAALPDLIFTVLFFFMIVTTMRQADRLVSYRVPQGNGLSKLIHKSSVSYINIGPPAPHLQSSLGTATCIQLNDKLATPDDIAAYISEERRRMSPEDARRQTVSIRADRETDMGIIADVKMALRRANATRVNYSASPAPSAR